MDQISPTLKAIFVLISFLTVWQFHRASHKSRPLILTIAIWMAIQLLIGRSHFYENGYSLPPRYLLLVAPPLLLILGMFILPKGRKFIDKMDSSQLVLLHTIRIGVEIVLYFLFLAKAIPEIMTFEGRNFDILAGLTAPLIYYFGFIRQRLPASVIIIWNLLSLGLLINIVVIALLSAPTPLQRFGFDQPNIAIAHFPFNWLPSVVVPIVLFSHLVVLRKMSKRIA